MTTTHDPVLTPAHYTAYAVQPLEITRYLGFSLGNVVKYVLRAPHKNGLEDLDKALNYLTIETDTPDAHRQHNVARALGPLFGLRYELARDAGRYGVYLREFLTALETYLHSGLRSVTADPHACDAMREVITGMRRMMAGPGLPAEDAKRVPS